MAKIEVSNAKTSKIDAFILYGDRWYTMIYDCYWRDTSKDEPTMLVATMIR